MRPAPLLATLCAFALLAGAASAAPQDTRSAFVWDVVVQQGKDGIAKASEATLPGETGVVRLGAETAYASAFDARGSVFEGCTIRLCGAEMPGRVDAVAVAFEVSEARLAGPARKRQIRPAKDADALTIELPRVDTMQIAGGRVAQIGRRIELATLRRGDVPITFKLTVTRRVEALSEGRSDELKAFAEIVTLGVAPERALLVDLATPPEGQGASGFFCGSDTGAMKPATTRPWTVVGSFETTSILGPGFRLRHGDDLAYVKSLALDADGRVKPDIVTVRGGVTVTAASSRSFHASWTDLVYWGPRRVELAEGFAQEADRVETNEDANDAPVSAVAVDGSEIPVVRLTVRDRRTR